MHHHRERCFGFFEHGMTIFFTPVLLTFYALNQIFLLGAVAKLGATVITYPLLVVKVSYFVKFKIACHLLQSIGLHLPFNF